MPNPRLRRAIAAPMRPSPTMPSVAPCTSWPVKPISSQVFHRPDRVNLSPSTTRRAVAMRIAHAMSAVVSVSTPGVFVTRMPRRVAAGTSMLS